MKNIILMLISQKITTQVRNSRSQMYFKIGALRNFVIFKGKQLCWSVLNKIPGLKACNFIKRRLQHRCFLMDIAKF